jgi:hypothetical protein
MVDTQNNIIKKNIKKIILLNIVSVAIKVNNNIQSISKINKIVI